MSRSVNSGYNANYTPYLTLQKGCNINKQCVV